MGNDTNNWIQRMRDTGVFPVGSDRPHPQVYIIDRQTGVSYEMGGVIPITLAGGEVFECEYRGPHIDFSKPYAACLGSAHTFGRFVTMPYPRLLHERLQQQPQVLNLGYGGVGPEFYLGLPDLLRAVNQSMFVVIQVMSARSVSTRDWQIIWGITGRSLPDGELMTLPHFIRKLATTHDGVARFIQECRQEYIVAMKRLLGAITVPKVLFWFSDRRPNELAVNGGPLGKYPQLVDDDIMSYLRPFADGYVECVCSNYGNLSPKHDTRFYYPSQKMHAQAADMLCEWATRTIDRPSASSFHHGV